jgi:hypothetical protein
MPRDNFSKTVTEKLRKRVRDQCSNPDCRASTVAAGHDITAVVSIGVGSHIHAASPGGARYSKEMSTAERTAIQNGIWLCQTCSVLIDRDENEFPPTLLLRWKAEAEQRARAQIGKPLPSEHDARDQVASMLTGLPTSFAPTAIANAHRASALALESIDPRFHVVTSHHAQKTVIELRPREHVPVSFVISPEARPEWARQLAGLVQHGNAMRISAEGARLKGSPLFDEVLSPEEIAGGHFVMTPHGKRAVMKMSVVESDGSLSETMDDVIGELVGGTDSISFNGHCCGDLFSLALRHGIPGRSPEGDLSMVVDFPKWVGRDLAWLPYFDKIQSFYSKIAAGKAIELAIEFEGANLLTTRVTLLAETPKFAAALVILEYTRRARVLCLRLKKSVTFQLSPPFDADGHTSLARAVDVFEGDGMFDGELDCASCELLADKGAKNIRALKADTNPHIIEYVQRDGDELTVFGQLVSLPPARVTMNGVIAEVTSNLRSIKEGDAVRIDWTPIKGARITRSFENFPTESA